MRTLAFDTSGAACSIALFENGALIAERHEIVGRGHAERLIPWIAGLPDGGRADIIIVGCGPGSFTGVRIGIAAARALALGWHVPVTGVSSLSLIAAGSDAGTATVAVEAGHGEIFIQRFSINPVTPLDALRSCLPADFAGAPNSLVIGSGAERLVAAWGHGAALPAEARAAHVARLPAALTNLPPTPIYGRGPDARPMP